MKFSSSILVGLALLLFCGSTLQAQDSTFTLKESVLERFSRFYPERLQQLQWIKDSDQVSYVDDHEGESALFTQSIKGKPRVALSVSTLEEWIGDEAKLGSFPRITWLSQKRFQFRHKNDVIEVDLKQKKAAKKFTLPEGSEAVTFNQDRSACAYVNEHNLYVLQALGEEAQVTEDGKAGIVYGKAVHRNEFGINGGLFWSPDGKRLAFYRMDETMVEDYPIVDISQQPATARMIKYPMAGRASHHVTLGSFDLQSGQLAYMQTGEPNDQYLCSVTWGPNNASLYVALLNRDQNHLTLNRYNASNGAFELTLFEEKDEAYVEPEHPLWFLPNDPTKFLWMSERDGFNHLYLYSDQGELLRPLTMGDWEVLQILGMDESERYLYVQGTGEPTHDGPEFNDERNGTQKYTYVIDIELGGRNIIDDRFGTHIALLNDQGTHLVEHFTSIDTPWETTFWTSIGEMKQTIHAAEDPLDGYAVSKPELGHIASGAGGSRLYTRIIKPSNFDENETYPVLLYVYGGPHAQLITNSYLAGAPMWMYWMAEQGYIVATVDSRGSSHRGIEFEQEIFRNLGQAEMVDQKLFADYLADLPYIDGTRMAVHGWSYGGFMTINLMLTFPDLFKAGVAGGPVCDWSMYEVMYTERYMDTPEANALGYERANLVQRAGDLKDDLLVIHGTVDDVVVWQHSQALVKACIDQEIQLDYFLYPNHPHNVRGKDRYHLMEKVLGYIDDHIGTP